MTEIERLDREITEINGRMANMEADIKRLLAIANIGQGALWALLRVGAIAAVLVGAIAWVWDHVSWK